MTVTDTSGGEARIAELEAENAHLRDELARRYETIERLQHSNLALIWRHEQAIAVLRRRPPFDEVAAQHAERRAYRAARQAKGR